MVRDGGGVPYAKPLFIFNMLSVFSVGYTIPAQGYKFVYESSNLHGVFKSVQTQITIQIITRNYKLLIDKTRQDKDLHQSSPTRN